MKTLVQCSILLLVVIILASCAPYQGRTVFGIYITGSSTSGGGLMRIGPDQAVDPIIPSAEITAARKSGKLITSKKIIDLPSSAKNLFLRYDPPYSEGTFLTMEEWFVDNRLCQQEKAEDRRGFRGFTFENRADGAHDVRLIVHYAFAGSRQSAGADTMEVRVRTYRDN